MGNTPHKHESKPSPNKCVDGCKTRCGKFLASSLCLIVIIVAIAEIAVTVTNGLTTKLYSEELSGRLVAMAVLALTAAVTVVISVYALVGLIKKKKKPLHVARVVLFVMAIIQALLCGIAVKVSPHDEATLSNSLAKSFNLALDGHPRHYKLWEMTNSGLHCCGLNGPLDYQVPGTSVVFAPNVPISCCKNYDPDRSDLLQEKERQDCRSRMDYYPIGCGGLVKTAFRNSASAVLSTTIAFIVLEVLLAAACCSAFRKYDNRDKKKNKKEECHAVHVAKEKPDTQEIPDTQETLDIQEIKVTQDFQDAQFEVTKTHS